MTWRWKSFKKTKKKKRIEKLKKVQYSTWLTGSFVVNVVEASKQWVHKSRMLQKRTLLTWTNIFWSKGWRKCDCYFFVAFTPFIYSITLRQVLNLFFCCRFLHYYWFWVTIPPHAVFYRQHTRWIETILYFFVAFLAFCCFKNLCFRGRKGGFLHHDMLLVLLPANSLIFMHNVVVAGCCCCC